MLIDTHAHINSSKFEDDKDRAEAVDRAKESGLVAIVNFGDTMASSAHCVELTDRFDICYAGVGIHPEEAFPMTSADDEQIAKWCENKKIVAVGEIGLDYYWEKDSEKRKLQKQIFIRQLDLARQLHMPVCVHDRDAHGDSLAIVKKEAQGVSGVFHCFAGSYEMAMELIKLGWYIGVDGPLTFKNAAKLPEIVQKVPLERILVETDCPYMAPVPMRGKRNEPSYVRFVAEKLAELRGESVEKVMEQTTRNALEIYPRLRNGVSL